MIRIQSVFDWLIFSCVMFSACSLSTISEETSLTIDSTIEEELFLSKIYEDIKYMSLDREEVVGEISKLIITSNNIFVLDREIEQKVYCYDREGKLIMSIDEQGRGPGEYTEAEDLAIDSVNQEIIILSTGMKKCLVYDFEGKHLRDIPFNYWATRVEIIAPGQYLLYSGNIYNPEISNHNLSVVNRSGEILKSFLPITKGEEKIAHEYPVHFIPYGQGFLFFPSFLNKVYFVSSEGISLWMEIGFKSNPPKLEDRSNITSLEWMDLMENLKKPYLFGHLIPGDHLTYFSLSKDKKVGHLFITHLNGRQILSFNIQNDLDSISFFMPPLIRFQGQHVGILPMDLPLQLKESYNMLGKKVPAKVEELAKYVEQSGNPLLFFAKLNSDYL